VADVSTFTPTLLADSLRRLLPPDANKLCVAYSGGLDSTVLLVALSQLRASAGYELRALHVDHQLQAGSARWAQECRRRAAQLGIAFESLRVEVRARDLGIEGAARAARYEALKGALRGGEVLLTAHHADDQLETVLLALVRGAGLRGLSAAPPVQRFGIGWLVRPLLEFTRAELEAWAHAAGLEWIDDPTNEHLRFDRNFLRHDIVPKLRARWPQVARSATRSAAHLTEAEQLLDELAELDWQRVGVGQCLDVSKLRELSGPRRRNVLRHWLRARGVRAPSTRRLAAIEFDMLASQADRVPVAKLDHAEIRRHRDLLYCEPARPAISQEVMSWDTHHELALPGGLGVLRIEAVPQGGAGLSRARMPERLEVRFRRGGENFKASGDAHRRSLKKRLQEARVLPWWRKRLPLLYAGEALVAVGDLWVSDAFAARAEEDAVRIVWADRPPLFAPR